MPHQAYSTVDRSLATFFDAFSALDRPRVEACFTDDATAINAWGGPRQDGFWCDEFDSWRATRPGPPYMRLEPKDLRLQALGDDVVVVTFHLDTDPTVERRRTLVFVRTDNGWKIAHLHASNVSRPV